MSFSKIPVSSDELRTNSQFRNRFQKEHHKESSVLEQLPIDMVLDFITSDSLHLIDLGIVKRFLLRWLFGEKRVRRTWNEQTHARLNLLLAIFNRTRPKELHRKIRSFKHIHFWKGTEYHTFLCYVAVVLLKDFLNASEYEHFLKFFCATSICLTDSYKAYLPKASELFKDFIEESIEIYGDHTVTSNMHNLCHITDEVERFGNLNSINAYPFENELYRIKTRIRQPNKALVQTARRFSESSIRSKSISFDKDFVPSVENEFTLPNLPHLQFFKQVNFKGFILSKTRNNNWFLTKENDIVLFEYAFITDTRIFLRGARLRSKTDFFKQPFSSRFLNIYISNCEKYDSQNFEIDCVKAKLFALPYENKHVFMPLLHTIH